MPHPALQPGLRNVAILIAALACSAAASAQGVRAHQRALLDLELRAQTVGVVAIEEDRVVYLDDTGRRRTAMLRDLVAILPTGASDTALPARSPARRPGVLELTDAQRYPGEHTASAAPDEQVIWRHPLLGQLAFPLDDVARAVLQPGGEALFDGRLGADAALRDAVLLTNNDVVTGFVLSLANPIEIETPSGVLSVPPERVLAVSMANPAQHAKGMMVWLDDGAAARVLGLRAEGGEWIALAVSDARNVRTTLASVRALVPEAARLRPLAAIAPTEQSAPSDRRTFDPARTLDPDDALPVVLHAHDIRYPGPMRVTYELPAGARRFGALAEMPRAAMPWGDCELVIHVDSREVFRQRLNADTPTADVSVPANGRTLTITIDEGAHGPINDIVILRRPLILVDQPEG